MSIFTSYHSYSSSNNFSNSMTSSHTSYSSGGSIAGSFAPPSSWGGMNEEMLRCEDMRGAPLMVNPENAPPPMVNPEDVHMEFIDPNAPVSLRFLAAQELDEIIKEE